MTQLPQFPVSRPRRLRRNAALRNLVRETTLTPHDLIYPLFIKEGDDLRLPIASMPGQFQFSVDNIAAEAKAVAKLGIPAVILFGIPAEKDAHGSQNFNPDGVIAQAIKTIKDAVPDLLVISDMCFCEYTDHGHCGVINISNEDAFTERLPEGYLLNDPTLENLAKASVVHAQAGADIIAPSGMVDGMVGAIRAGLDASGHEHIPIMSYAAKYSSAFYGPFRDAAESAPGFGDRSAYQMDPSNAREALKEVELDVAEGADMLMVKPALPYLDIIRMVRDRYTLPIAAYQVSGEFSMIHAAAANGWMDLRRTALESLTSIKRAGADMILTYFAKDVVKWLEE